MCVTPRNGCSTTCSANRSPLQAHTIKARTTAARRIVIDTFNPPCEKFTASLRGYSTVGQNTLNVLLVLCESADNAAYSQGEGRYDDKSSPFRRLCLFRIQRRSGLQGDFSFSSGNGPSPTPRHTCYWCREIRVDPRSI